MKKLITIVLLAALLASVVVPAMAGKVDPRVNKAFSVFKKSPVYPEIEPIIKEITNGTAISAEKWAEITDLLKAKDPKCLEEVEKILGLQGKRIVVAAPVQTPAAAVVEPVIQKAPEVYSVEGMEFDEMPVVNADLSDYDHRLISAEVHDQAALAAAQAAQGTEQQVQAVVPAVVKPAVVNPVAVNKDAQELEAAKKAINLQKAAHQDQLQALKQHAELVEANADMGSQQKDWDHAVDKQRARAAAKKDMGKQVARVKEAAAQEVAQAQQQAEQEVAAVKDQAKQALKAEKQVAKKLRNHIDSMQEQHAQEQGKAQAAFDQEKVALQAKGAEHVQDAQGAGQVQVDKAHEAEQQLEYAQVKFDTFQAEPEAVVEHVHHDRLVPTAGDAHQVVPTPQVSSVDVQELVTTVEQAGMPQAAMAATAVWTWDEADFSEIVRRWYEALKDYVPENADQAAQKDAVMQLSAQHNLIAAVAPVAESTQVIDNTAAVGSASAVVDGASKAALAQAFAVRPLPLEELTAYDSAKGEQAIGFFASLKGLMSDALTYMAQHKLATGVGIASVAAGSYITMKYLIPWLSGSAVAVVKKEESSKHKHKNTKKHVAKR